MLTSMWEPLSPEVKRCFLHQLELYQDASDGRTRYYEQTLKLKAKLEKETTALGKRIAELERQLRETQKELELARRSEKRQATPFSKGPPQEHPRRPGRAHGHQPARRAIPNQVDEVVEVELTACPHCQLPVTADRVEQQFIEDIEVRPRVRQFNIHSGHCPGCGKRVRNLHPGQLSQARGAAQVQVGEKALSLAVDLKHRLGVPYRKIVDLVQTHFGLRLTAGGLVQSGRRIQQKLQPVHDSLLDSLRNSAVCHADETGWKVGGKPTWLWVFTNQEHTAYVVGGRGQDVIRRTLGDQYQGVLVSDCFVAYDSLPWKKAKCLGHMLHEMSELLAVKKRPARAFLREAMALFRRAIQLKPKKARMKPSSYKSQATLLEKQLNGLLRRNLSDEDNVRLAKRFRKQREHLLRFLYHDLVEPTNNHAERQIRPAVIARKLSGCNRTDAGAETHSTLASLVVTCRQQGQSFVDLVRSALSLRPSVPLPVFVPALRPP